MKIVIDLDKWTTQKQKAATHKNRKGTLGVSVEYICNQIRKGKLKSRHIRELNLTLVEK